MPFFRPGCIPSECAADDLVLDRDALAALVGLNLDDDVAVLAAATGLLDQFAFAVRRRGDRLAIGDLRLARVRVDLELAQHAVANDLEVQLAHAGDDRLAGVFVGEDLEGRIFFGQPLQRDRHLFLVLLRLRLDRHRDNRVREGRRLEQDRKIFIAQRVAGGDVLDADDRRDVAGVTGVDVLALVGLDLDQAADALALVGARIVNRVALCQLAGIDAEEDELADERVAPELEGERAELAVVVRRRFHLLVRVGIHPDCGRNVERAGKIIDHRVDQILHALVLEGGAADNRDELVRDRLPADARLQHLRRDRLLFENCFPISSSRLEICFDQIAVGFVDRGLCARRADRRTS